MIFELPLFECVQLNTKVNVNYVNNSFSETNFKIVLNFLPFDFHRLISYFSFVIFIL
jgi:hypothetical protein